MQRGNIIDYELPDEAHSVMHGSVSAGTVVPLIVVAVDDDGGTYSGVAFLPNGQTEYVTAEIPESAPEAEPEPESQTEPARHAEGQTVQHPETGGNQQ